MDCSKAYLVTSSLVSIVGNKKNKIVIHTSASYFVSMMILAPIGLTCFSYCFPPTNLKIDLRTGNRGSIAIFHAPKLDRLE